jgi:uncharacterized membrane protein required for colicin V production
MIAVEYFWLILIFVFGIIGAVRGLGKELGTTAIVCLSLFALWLGWDQAGNFIVSLVGRLPFGKFTEAQIQALYYSGAIAVVAFISYEGVVLEFPVRLKGFLKNVFGFLGGLVNGYFIVGTVWDVVAHADYFLPQIKVVTAPFSGFHNTVIQYLPVTLMNDVSPLPMLVLGMLLLLAVVFK